MLCLRFGDGLELLRCLEAHWSFFQFDSLQRYEAERWEGRICLFLPVTLWKRLLSECGECQNPHPHRFMVHRVKDGGDHLPNTCTLGLLQRISKDSERHHFTWSPRNHLYLTFNLESCPIHREQKSKIGNVLRQNWTMGKLCGWSGKFMSLAGSNAMKEATEWKPN